MEIFNTREIATGIWSGIVIVVALASPSVRKSLFDVVKAFFTKGILIPLGLMLVYIVGVIYELHELGLWGIEQLKPTILWVLTAGFFTFFSLNKIADNQNYFSTALKDNFKIILILEFIVTFYTFSLWVELLIIPFTAILGMMLALAERKKEHAILKIWIERILAIFGFSIMSYAAYRLLGEFSDFAKMETLTDFLLPPVLSILLLPFLYAMSLFMIYQNVFLGLRFAIKDTKLRRYAQWQAIFRFHVRTGLLKRWRRNIIVEQAEDKEAIKKSIREAKILRSRELNPGDVPKDQGWSPYAAQKFLVSEGLPTSDYHRVSDEWYAGSNPLEIGDRLLRNNISYYIDGTEEVATHLKIILSCYEKKACPEAQEKFQSVCQTLFLAAFGKEIPDALFEHISEETETSYEFLGKKIILTKELWQNRTKGGHTLRFIIQVSGSDNRI